MKKNLFMSMLALSGMLFATSCSHEELVNEPVSQELVSATFTIGTADGIGTRAVGDGTTVDKVACAVYDAYNNEELKELRQDVEITGKTATYSVRLAKGKNYRVAFFAYNEAAAAYDVTDLKNIIVNNDQKSNVEGRDAFTAYVDVKEGETMNAFTKKVDLKRPFAQLNLGIDDTELAEAAKAGLVVDESKIVVTNVYNAFSAYNNAVAENAVEGSMTFELNDIPTDKLKVTVNGEERLYNYLALNYLLVGDKDSEKTLTDVEFTWKSDNGDTNAESVTEFKNVPVQRNYRTNIVGKLLTSPTIFNISIDEDFDYETTIGDKDYNIYKVFSAQDLQAALDAAPEGYTTTIYLGADIVGDVTDVQKPGRKVVIDGCDYKYNGSIKVHSNSNYYADAALTIKNVNFETSTASVNIIEALENDSERYSNNITVEDCTFTATDEAINTSVAVQVKATRNVTVTRCTATNMHSLIQAQSCDTGDVKVVYCTVNGKNGVAFKQVKSATVEGSTINAIAYGIRFDGNTDNYGIIVKDNNVKASQPFIVRRMTGANNTIALEGENTLTVPTASASTDAPAYQIIITNGEDDAEYVKPTGTYTLTGADNYLVYPTQPKKIFADNSWEFIISACQDNDIPNTWNIGDRKTMTIDGREYQIAIIGKNHDEYTAGGKAPLTFQLAEVYGTAPMNNTQTNTTGWSESAMRTTTMVNILSAMPSEVQSAIKAVDKKTLNGNRDNLETTSDKLFLLSEIEVNGSVYFSNNFSEGTRYSYYTDLNSQIMNSGNNPASWWLRGPGKNNDIGFTQINASGYMANGSAEYACGVVFGFCF